MGASLIRGRYLVSSHDRVIPNGALYQENGKIVEVGDSEQLRAKFNPRQELGSEGCVVIPGLVDSHCHGRGITTIQLGALDEALEFRGLSWRAMLRTDCYLDTMYAAIQLVESGVTTAFHSNVTRQATQYESGLREGLQAYLDLGMRVAYAVNIRTERNFVYEDDEVFARSLPAELQERMRRLEVMVSGISASRCLAAFDALHRDFASHRLVRLLFAPTAPQWNTPETLQAIKEKANGCGAGFQMHVLETPYQRSYGRRQHGKSLVEYLHDQNLLGPDVSLAHAVWATERDLDLLAKTGTSVVHNPSSNLRLKSGIAPAIEMLDRGINVGLGTDSIGLNDEEDMIQEMRLCLNLHRPPGIGKKCLVPREVLKMATTNGARIVQFGDAIGALTPGREADAVLLRLGRLTTPYLDPALDIVDTLLYRAKAQDVDTVVVAGEPILKDGKLVKVSKEEIVGRLIESMAAPSRAAAAEMQERRSLVRDLRPFIEDFYASWLPEKMTPFYLFNSKD